MESILKLRVVTPSGMLLDVSAKHVVLESEIGKFGVLPGHEPMLAAILPGDIYYETTEGSFNLVTNGGVVEIKSNKITVLA